MSGALPIVAVVEDEDQVRNALDRLLRSAGFQVVAYASGDEFLRHVASRPPACVVLDLHMPGASGYDVQAAIVRRNLPIAVVVLTGNDTPEGRKRVLDAGAHSFLCKPVDANALIDAIRQAIRDRTSAA